MKKPSEQDKRMEKLKTIYKELYQLCDKEEYNKAIDIINHYNEENDWSIDRMMVNAIQPFIDIPVILTEHKRMVKSLEDRLGEKLY